MPIVTCQSHILSVLDQVPLPQDLGILQAFIQPLNPNTEAADNPQAFIWGSTGDEVRLSFPRAQPGNLASGGNKTLTHQLDVWLVYFGGDDDPKANTNFPGIVDAVMAVLRNTAQFEATKHAVDPVTGQISNLLAIGENMNWQQGTIRALVDQRMLRFDALITCEVTEIIQA